MRKTVKSLVSAVLCASMLLSVSACEQTGGTEGQDDTPVTTNEEYTPLQDHVKELASKVDSSIKVEKKIRWLSHWAIDETDAPSELFKSYGIPEEGDSSYGNDANNIFDYIKVDLSLIQRAQLPKTDSAIPTSFTKPTTGLGTHSLTCAINSAIPTTENSA